MSRLEQLKARRDKIEEEITAMRHQQGCVDYETLEGLENELEDVLAAIDLEAN